MRIPHIILAATLSVLGCTPSIEPPLDEAPLRSDTGSRVVSDGGTTGATLPIFDAGMYCRSDAEMPCRDGYVCVGEAGEGRCQVCGDDGDCPSGLHCVQMRYGNQCRECGDDSHCPDGLHCTREGTCEVCASDDQCPRGLVCTSTYSQPDAGYVGGVGCYECEDYRNCGCLERCDRKGECVVGDGDAGSWCRPIGGDAGYECNQDEDCGCGELCSSIGKCISGGATPDGGCGGSPDGG